MKKALVLGSAAADIIIRVPSLPKTEEDFSILSQKISLGGCAYNVSHILHCFHIPYTLFAPTGKGLYGDFVRRELKARGVHTAPIPKSPEENGCCYCFVEDSGERTFLSLRGAEYRFQKDWFPLLNPTEYDSAYFCGLELEEESGELITDFFRLHPDWRLYFAPGPRLSHIPKPLLKKALSLHPVLHLNLSEAYTLFECLTGQKKEGSPMEGLPETARFLCQMVQNEVIITLGGKGAYWCTGAANFLLPARPVPVLDTIGAGDAHIGTVIACEMAGCLPQEAVETANLLCAAVVQQQGASLSQDAFYSSFQSLPEKIKAHFPL